MLLGRMVTVVQEQLREGPTVFPRTLTHGTQVATYRIRPLTLQLCLMTLLASSC
ncbi:hypothetical protein THIARS_90027 [Thiomonas delicata]|uniref:Uncharacterized protein n=1 Tax=Thiomonas delicata TaxID=364030 RepID=A0A238D996_THIDL|nr:hypothetical protein THIARS_90027 [Thiomonas delicata]